MTIQTISSSSIAILIDKHDFQTVGATAKELDLNSTRPIVSTALIEAGFSTDGVLEIEAFQNGENVLIFARILASEPAFFRFDEFEELLSAISVLPDIITDSTLIYMDFSYYLAVPKDEYFAVVTLEEFGERLNRPASFLLHLLEHGAPICRHSAIRMLQQYF